jgi:hypothetical protein
LEDIKTLMPEGAYKTLVKENLIHEGFHAVNEATVDIYPKMVDIAKNEFDVSPLVRMTRPWMKGKTLNDLMKPENIDDARRALKEVGVEELPTNAPFPEGRKRKYTDEAIDALLADKTKLRERLRDDVFAFAKNKIRANPESFTYPVLLATDPKASADFLVRYTAWLKDTDLPLKLTLP